MDKPGLDQVTVNDSQLQNPIYVAGYSWNRLGEMSFLAGTKPLMTELANHH